MTEHAPPLSPAGRRRREAIAALARDAARRRRRHRRAARGLLLAAVVAAAAYAVRPRTVPREPVLVEQTPPAPIIPTPSQPTIARGTTVVARIETDPTISSRLSLPRQPRRWRVIGDEELLQSLADAGHPAALIQTRGQTILLTR